MYSQRIPELEPARTYGILGIILEFFGGILNIFINYAGLIAEVLGLILLLNSMNLISNYYDNKKPFKYMLASVISGILIGLIVILVFGISSYALTTHAGTAPPVSPAYGLLVSLFILLLGVIASIIFEYFAYKSVYELTGVRDFNTAANMLLIGVILTIIIIGILLIFIGIIFVILGFNKLPSDAKPRNPVNPEEGIYDDMNF
ncbi:hypothetical protein SE19_04795 [Acidiplasma aeolicum]|uniref:DUF996 domain-containing protein n=1 Tax=Acidiplasma aeolicum TaxID=507754 RepID=A0A0P9CUI4_9ARCH|nr:DUF996 domain-containing protein [Acidiplasma aeolicum]KPV46610.1 hypothetical protein SE19_04795 [Acidiplasma aeolicum]